MNNGKKEGMKERKRKKEKRKKEKEIGIKKEKQILKMTFPL